MELEDKFLVLKWSDMTAALTPEQKVQLTYICTAVADWRTGQGKPRNKYVVINQDESYFPDVLKLMEVHQKSAERAADTARRRTQGAKDGWEIWRAKQKG